MMMLMPRDLSGLFAALGENPEATLMAGGTDLLPRRRIGKCPPGPVVGLSRIEELGRIEDGGDHLRIGATASFTAIMEHPLVKRWCPLLVQAASVLGSPLIRNMGTIGGNIATASPAADSLPPLYAHEAQVELASAGRVRLMPLAACIAGPGVTRIAPGEVIAAVIISKEPVFDLAHFEKVGRRSALAISVVSLAVLLAFDARGRVEKARLAVGSAGPTVIRCTRAEAALTGRKPGKTALTRAAALIRSEVAPISDVRASASYRRQVAGNLLLRFACPPHTGA